jgi:hypothetical protein
MELLKSIPDRIGNSADTITFPKKKPPIKEAKKGLFYPQYAQFQWPESA